MSKPNRYMGNGKVYPNGTVIGRYIMRNGHWIDQDSPAARSPKETRKGLSGWLVSAMLGLILLFILLDLTGCQVNVVNVVHSDIGVQAIKEVQ